MLLSQNHSYKRSVPALYKLPHTFCIHMANWPQSSKHQIFSGIAVTPCSCVTSLSLDAHHSHSASQGTGRSDREVRVDRGHVKLTSWFQCTVILSSSVEVYTVITVKTDHSLLAHLCHVLFMLNMLYFSPQSIHGTMAFIKHLGSGCRHGGQACP